MMTEAHLHPETPGETPAEAPQNARDGDFAENPGRHSSLPDPGADSDDSGYGAGSIRILNVAAQRERFSFAAAVALAADYPHVPADAIHRLLTAAEISGTPREDIVARYLENNRTVAITPEFQAAYAELMAEARQRTERIAR